MIPFNFSKFFYAKIKLKQSYLLEKKVKTKINQSRTPALTVNPAKIHHLLTWKQSKNPDWKGLLFKNEFLSISTFSSS